jgi:hypothetical protein
LKSKDVEKKAATKPADKEEPTSKGKRGFWSQAGQTLLIPALAVFTGLVFGAIIIIITDAHVLAAYKNFFSAPAQPCFPQSRPFLAHTGRSSRARLEAR